MSVEVTAWAWRQQVGSARGKLLLIKLADSANDDGISWPSVRTLARQTEISKSAVDRNLRELEQRGFVQRLRRARSNGSNSSNVYRVLWEQVSHPGGTPLVPSRRDTLSLLSGTPYEPSIEPSETEVSSVKEIFDYWVSQRRAESSRRLVLTPGREKKIKTRLKEYSVEDLKRAIDGVANDPWEGRAMQDDLTIIFRNAEQVDKFLALAENGKKEAGPVYARLKPGEQF